MIAQIVEHLTAPVAVSYMQVDAFPANHPLAVGTNGYMGSKAAMHTLKKAELNFVIRVLLFQLVNSLHNHLE